MMDEKTIERIKEMEGIFDALLEAEAENSATDKELLERLLRYYAGGQWLKDFELDEKGLFPAELKRGVLSEDGVFKYLQRLADRDMG